MAQTTSVPLVLQEFNCKSTVEEWNACYRNGGLLVALKKHWKMYVPFIYNFMDNPAKEERMAKKLLFKPMEVFLCNSTDPDSVLQTIKENDKPALTCGHVFKSGEPTYSCRDCANDPTCVLCIKCFEQSAHREHRYRMNMSGGGGYCDCGDEEAWKVNASCLKHRRTAMDDTSQNSVELLPDDLVDRASTLFLSTLRYAVDLLTWEHSDNLPPELQPDGELTDTYVTMLFNDEVHTYDQVISALTKALNCTNSEATEFATIVDREGRSRVKHGSFHDCEKVRAVIEKTTSRQLAKPLKVQVMHERVIAFQQLALQMIPWLRHIISSSDGLRRLFCMMSMQKQDDCDSLLLRLLLADTKLWKVARVQSHQLFMSGVLMDQECKIQFATMFTQHYNDIMRAFILDDHYRAVSISSISVQIFTVPTLARMLIMEHDLLGVVMRSFLVHCQSKKNSQGKLSFQPSSDRHQALKRAWYMLYDYKYALLSKPATEDWHDKLRVGYLSGFCALLELLQAMQGMDAVTRQTGQHLEFEPEWESAFNLQLKLNDNLQLIVHWSASDQHVLIECYKHCLEVLASSEQSKTLKFEACEHTVTAVKYDVSSQPVSIHIPVTRLLAALHVHLGKYGLSFNSAQFSQTKVTARDLIEMSLRVRVLVAQAHAGMWRRNGYSLVNQIFFYHNVKCRVQMHDKDILMLQIGASLMTSNDFLLHLMNKFGLSSWGSKKYQASSGQEDKLNRTVTMAEEFLSLLIHILSERYTVGVGDITKDAAVKREIIHQLCIAPLAHSELAKALPEDENNETGMEDVVNELATFRVPTDKDKGKYELKEQYYKDYSMYFYHYSKAEQSKSEEAQLKRKRQANQTLALPPPIPVAFLPQFAPIIHILDCDVMIYIMEMVLMRTQSQTSRFWSEAQLDRLLHLIGLALHEQKRALEANNAAFDFMSKATKEGGSILSYLESLVSSTVITHDSQKDLITWLLKMFTDIRRMKNHPAAPETSEDGIRQTSTRLSDEKKHKSLRAEKRRAKIMSQMCAMQRSFIEENSELFESADTELNDRELDMDVGDSGSVSDQLIAVGPKRSRSLQSIVSKVTCILCQEEQEITFSNRTMVLAAFVQQSTVLSQRTNKDMDKNWDPLFMGTDLACGVHTSTCGHAMHAECWQSLYETIVSREQRRPLRLRYQLSYNIDRNEFMCPLCEFISNTVCPVVPSLLPLIAQTMVKCAEEGKLCRCLFSYCLPPDDNVDKSDVQLSFNDWLDGIEKTVKASVTNASDGAGLLLPGPMSAITKLMADSVARNFQLLWEYVSSDSGGLFSTEIKEMVKKFAVDVYKFGVGVEAGDNQAKVAVLAWSTCAFTIKSIEQAARFEGQWLNALSSRQDDCLSCLVRFAAVVNVVEPPDTVKAHCMRLLRALISPDETNDTNVLDLDMFHYLVLLVMSLPSLHRDATSQTTIPTAGLNDQHALQLVLTAHLVQILLSPWTPNLDDEMEVDDVGAGEADTEAEALLAVYTDLHARIGHPSGVQLPPGRTLLRHTQLSCLPFLRCSALLFHYISGVDLPALALYGGEFETLCGYLSLSTSLSSLFFSHGDIIPNIIYRWCDNKNLQSRLASELDSLLTYPVMIKSLMKLPIDYSDLINTASVFTCPRSNGDESRAPTMCLVCRTMLCSQSYCCQTSLDGLTVGAVTHHAQMCGAGTAIFLRVRECQVLLLTGKIKGCFYSPPYLDNYGETDEGLRRGNPLYLSHDAYRRLQLLWLNHGIAEEIGHQLESHSSLLGIDWQHL